MLKTIKFHVTKFPEYSAGILGFTDTISIEITECPAIESECIEHFRGSIREWFQADRVETEQEYNERIIREA